MEVARLIEGYRQFRLKGFKEQEAKFVELAKKGQSPKTLFIGCSDSRLLPNFITSSGVGDLFIFRDVGNFVPPFKPDNDYHAAAAAIEYAVSILRVEEIIVCGHSHCGACAALYQELPEEEGLIHTRKWLELGQKAKSLALEQVGREDFTLLLRTTERLSVLVQLEHLLTYPKVREGVEEGRLHLHGWYFKIESGELEYFDQEAGAFKPL
ncbi:MAG: carbonic anhydrase [Nitratiruptor sp.]|nr:carbonic anhydrase [Nitratiruptor sp.]NPA83092.1 carbonic anhydrase [Campylobacterota bacterium]